jgi:hypothetical protein
MTTVRLTDPQKEKLEKVLEILEATLGRKLSRGEAIEALADFAARNREALTHSEEQLGQLRDDPFFDLSLTFDLGPTDERTHDRLLYRRR